MLKNNTDYTIFHDLEKYLLTEVKDRFEKNGYIEAFDFFCIIIWKANRSKTKIVKKLMDIAKSQDLNKICKGLTSQISEIVSREEKLKYLLENWKFRLPTASAILSILYPEMFTVYDIRVCEMLKKYKELSSKTKTGNIIKKYFEYIDEVIKSVPQKNSLRDKDRFLWGKSFFEELHQDINNNFKRLEK